MMFCVAGPLCFSLALGPTRAIELVTKIKNRLMTREDGRYYHFHKTLGLSCLASFAYRMANAGAADMRFGSSWQTLATLLLHATLSVSSLIFTIPIRRIKEGSRIWPEYRLHSIVFAWRSLLWMLVTWVEARLGVSTHGTEEVGVVSFLATPAIVFLTMKAADLGSWWVGEAGRSSTIRDLS